MPKRENCESTLRQFSHEMRDLAVARDFKGIYDLSKKVDAFADQFTDKCLKPDRERQKEIAERERVDWQEMGWPE